MTLCAVTKRLKPLNRLYRAYWKWLKPFSDFETVKTVEEILSRTDPMIEIMGYVLYLVSLLYDRGGLPPLENSE